MTIDAQQQLTSTLEKLETIVPENIVTQDTLIVLGITALITLIVGFFIGRAVSKGGAQKKELHAAQQELAQYKESVNAHFGQTADLIDDLTQSYKAVFDHLGSSAKDLLSEEQLQEHIESRATKSVTLTYQANASDEQTDVEFTEEVLTVSDKDQETKEKGAELISELADKVTDINEKRS